MSLVLLFVSFSDILDHYLIGCIHHQLSWAMVYHILIPKKINNKNVIINYSTLHIKYMYMLYLCYVKCFKWQLIIVAVTSGRVSGLVRRLIFWCEGRVPWFHIFYNSFHSLSSCYSAVPRLTWQILTDLLVHRCIIINIFVHNLIVYFSQ